MLDATRAPRGRELTAAVALRDWCAAQWPEITWAVQPYGPAGANLVASCGPGPLLYSHLDTSLDGSPDDEPVTGPAGDAGTLSVRDGSVEGFGLGVARGPAAAALVAFVTARRGTLLLAGSGTHRRGSTAAGVLRYLADAPEHPAAVVAKCGPVGVLWEEPGAAYLRLRVAGEYGAVLAYSSAVPAGGVIAHLGPVLEAVEAWRTDYLRTRTAVGQLGVAAGIGAIHGGLAAKPDLFAGAVDIGLYAVTLPGEDVRALADSLAGRVRAACAGSALSACEVSVDVEPIHAAASTSAEAPIVRAAVHAWSAEFGSPPPEITGWTGSTDGVVLRAHGIDTVRVGPQSARADDDPRRDVLELKQLETYSHLYARLLR